MVYPEPMKSLLPMLLLALACSGLPGGETPVAEAPPVETPPAEAPPTEPTPAETPANGGDPAWVADAVKQALEWEIMPGTTGEPEPGRADQLRTFFLAHPEYADPARREPLALHACGLGTEAAHTYLTSPPPKTPVEISVTTDDWRVVVAHASKHCTSDDWSYYTSEVGQALDARGVKYEYGGPDNDVAVVKRDGAEVGRIPLTGQGFAAARAGKAPIEVEYATTDTVLAGLDPYLGTHAP